MKASLAERDAAPTAEITPPPTAVGNDKQEARKTTSASGRIITFLPPVIEGDLESDSEQSPHAAVDNVEQEAGRIPRKISTNASKPQAGKADPATMRTPCAPVDPLSPLPAQPNRPAGSEPKLRLLSYDDSREKLRKCLGFAEGQTVEDWLESKVADCGEGTRAHWKEYLRKMLELVHKGFDTAYAYMRENPPSIQRLTYETAKESGVYKFYEDPRALRRKLGKHVARQEDPTTVRPAELAELASEYSQDPRGKVGRTTRSVEARVTEQLGELRDMGVEASACASMIVSSKQVDEIFDLSQFDYLNQEFVKLVESNTVPKLACHKDKRGLALRILKEEFIELVVMSASVGYTDGGGEVILAVPSAELEKLFEKSIYSPKVVTCLRNSVSFKLLLTWETLSTTINSMLNDNRIPEETRAVIRDNFNSEENRTFVQNYLQRFLTFGNSDKIASAVNSVSPSVTVRVIEEALPKITAAIRDSDKVRLKEILSSIGDRGNFEEPSTEVLGEGGMANLRETMSSHKAEDGTKTVVFERELVKAMKDTRKEEYQRLVAGTTKSSEDIVSARGTDVATLSTHPAGLQCLVTGSAHVAMGQNQTNKQRVAMVDQIIALMYPLCEAGQISRSHLESIIPILRAYAMNLDGLDGENDGSYNQARLLASPEGFFQDRANHEGGVVTAQTLGLSVQHTLVLFAKLDRGVWYDMFTLLDRAASPNARTPMEDGGYGPNSPWKKLLLEEQDISYNKNWRYPRWLMNILVRVVSEYFRTSGATSTSTISLYRLLNAALNFVLEDSDLPGAGALMVDSTPGGKPIGRASQYKMVLKATCSPSSTHSLTWIPNTVTPRARASDEVREAISVDDFVNGGGVSSAVMSAKARLSSTGKLANLEGSSYAKANPSVQASKKGKKRKRKRPAGKGPNSASVALGHETRRLREIKRDGAGVIELTCLRCVRRGETDPTKRSYSAIRIKELKKSNGGIYYLACPICKAAGRAYQHIDWDERKK